MYRIRNIKSLALAISTLVLSSSVNAALVERLGGVAYYDDEADLTWLADANHAMSSGYDDDGRMTWQDANIWAAGLSVHGVDGWRLPSSLNSDGSGQCGPGPGCTGSEMGNLRNNVLGADRTPSLETNHNSNYDLFWNIQSFQYWTATEYAPSTDDAWYYTMSDGRQNNQSKTLLFFAWAVQSGDVSAVPVPAAVWLFGSGLIGLVGLARRKV